MRLASMVVWVSTILLLVLCGCYNRPKAPEHLRVLFTSDTQGNFTPCGCAGGPRGGMERRSTAVAQARAEAPGPVILLDTGNFMTGLESDYERTRADFTARAMAQIGYDAVNVGRLDAKRPRLAVLQFNKPDAGFPLTSAAFTYQDPETGETRFSYPSRIVIERNRFRIGVVGHPLDDLDQSKLGVENNFDTDPFKFAQLLDDVYVKDEVQMLIVITDFSDTFREAQLAASRFPLASLVIAGQSASADFTEEKYGADVPHPLVVPRAMAWGRSLGVLDLDLSRTGGIIGYRLRYVDLNEDVPKDPALAEMTREYLEKIGEEPSGVPEVRTAGFTGSAACRDCHLFEFETWQTTRHASAWATLEETGRINEASCVPCHSTGYAGSGAIPSRMVPYENRNVGCESCHGPGEVHIQFQQYKIYGELTGQRRGENLTDPIIPLPPESMCVACHQPPYDEGWLYRVKLDRIRHERLSENR